MPRQFSKNTDSLYKNTFHLVKNQGNFVFRSFNFITRHTFCPSTTLWLIKCIESEFWVSDASSSNESHVHKLWPILYFLWHGWQMFKNLDWIAAGTFYAAFTLIWSKEKKFSASKLNFSLSKCSNYPLFTFLCPQIESMKKMELSK